jgi:hypothetical protein
MKGSILCEVMGLILTIYACYLWEMAQTVGLDVKECGSTQKKLIVRKLL